LNPVVGASGFFVPFKFHDRFLSDNKTYIDNSMINADRIMDLTRIQRDILTALVNIYRKENRPV
jgi:hypothetical protein